MGYLPASREAKTQEQGASEGPPRSLRNTSSAAGIASSRPAVDGDGPPRSLRNTLSSNADIASSQSTIDQDGNNEIHHGISLPSSRQGLLPKRDTVQGAAIGANASFSSSAPSLPTPLSSTSHPRASKSMQTRKSEPKIKISSGNRFYAHLVERRARHEEDERRARREERRARREEGAGPSTPP